MSRACLGGDPAYTFAGFLATKLSFVNAVAAVCENVGADVADVIVHTEPADAAVLRQS